MGKRCIVLGDGTRVGLGHYVEAWKRLKQLPGDTWIKKCPDGWGGSARDALRQCRAGLHDRINRHIPGHGKGRKWSDDWFWTARRFAADVNTPRLIVRWAPEDFRARLAHRLTTDF
jgi:hypothetical protein